MGKEKNNWGTRFITLFLGLVLFIVGAWVLAIKTGGEAMLSVVLIVWANNIVRDLDAEIKKDKD